MALLPKRANTEDNNEQMGDRTPVPAGNYAAMIVKSEMKSNKAKTGSFLALQFKIADGDQKGKIIYVNLNLQNPSAVAMEIAGKELNSICAACGCVGVEDSAELHDIPLIIKVKIKPAENGYEESNQIASYYHIDEYARIFGDAAESEATETQAETATEKQTEKPAEVAKPKKKLPWDK